MCVCGQMLPVIMVAASTSRQAAYIRDEFAINPADAATYPFLFCQLCQLCQYAVLVPSITNHMKDVHNSIPTRQRRVVRKVASQLPRMYQPKRMQSISSYPTTIPPP